MMRLTQNFDERPEAAQNNAAASAGVVPGVDLQECLSIFLRQKWTILATVTVIMALAFVVVSFLTPRYTANVLVQINPRQSQIVDFESVLSGLPAGIETIQTEIQIIKSRKIARRTVARLQLNKDPEFNSALRPAGRISSWRYAIAAWLTSLAMEREDDGLASAEDVKDESRGFVSELFLKLSGVLRPSSMEVLSEKQQVQRENDHVIDNFLQNLTVTPERRSRIVGISFESENPNSAAAVANTVADFYIVAQLEAKFEATKRATTWLSERVEKLRVEVRTKEQIVEEFRANSGLLQGGQDRTLTSEQVSELNAQHVTEITKLAEAEARLQQVNKLLTSSDGIESAIEVLASPLIRNLRMDETRIVREIAELSESYGERHPTMINARAEARDLQAKIKVEVGRIVQGLRNEVAVARARAAALVRTLESVKKQIVGLNQSEVQLRALEREATASRTILENLLERTKETISQESFQQADADIVSEATVPGEPSFPKKGVIFLLVFIAALMQGVFLAFVIDRLDLGFRSMEQVERLMGITPLGLIPEVSKFAAVGKKPHNYILENPGSAFSEAIRSLYTNILMSDAVQQPRVILVTSGLPGEGKTSVVLCLARLLSITGRKVIVVDCDFRKPMVHKELGIPPGTGLSDYLTGGVILDEIIHEDKDSGAQILQAGTFVRKSPEQLDSGLMQKLLKKLRLEYDVVLLDSPPVLAVSDPLFIARLADTTIFLIRWARTRRAAASMGLKRVLAAQANVAGVLLTMVDVKSHAQYGFGDSGSYYGKLGRYYRG
jgi:capsular exopolysaccharide synthesis family protein